MAAAGVSALGYLELGVSDPAAWRNYCEAVLGLATSPDGDAIDVRMDADRWRLRLLPTGEDDVRAIGLQVEDPGTLETIAERLVAHGHAVTADAAAGAGRGVDALYSCNDPDGLRIELYVGSRAGDQAFVSPAGVRGFVTDAQGLGHVVLMVSDADAAATFYQQGLGFRVSDYIVMGRPERALTLTFLHCNPRHHSVAYVPAAAPKRLNHLMLQTLDLDDVGRALDRAIAGDVPITSSLGRHTNDHMLSFYMRTPSGFDVEYGYGGREVDDADWQVVTYHATSIWGHRRHG